MTAVNRRVMRKHNEKMVPTHILGIWSLAAAEPEQFGSPLAAILVELKLQESDGRPHVTTGASVLSRLCTSAPNPPTPCLTGEIRVIDAELLEKPRLFIALNSSASRLEPAAPNGPEGLMIGQKTRRV